MKNKMLIQYLMVLEKLRIIFKLIQPPQSAYDPVQHRRGETLFLRRLEEEAILPEEAIRPAIIIIIELVSQSFAEEVSKEVFYCPCLTFRKGTTLLILTRRSICARARAGQQSESRFQVWV